MSDVKDERSDEYVEPQQEPTTRMLRQMVVQNGRSSESAHRRLREDLDDLKEAVERMETLSSVHAEHLSRIDATLNRPVEASSLRFTPGMVVAIVAVCASVIGGEYLSGSVVRSDVRDLSTKMDATEKRTIDYVKLQDERAANWSQAIVEIKAKQELLDVRMSNWVNSEILRRRP